MFGFRPRSDQLGRQVIVPIYQLADGNLLKLRAASRTLLRPAN